MELSRNCEFVFCFHTFWLVDWLMKTMIICIFSKLPIAAVIKNKQVYNWVIVRRIVCVWVIVCIGLLLLFIVCIGLLMLFIVCIGLLLCVCWKTVHDYYGRGGGGTMYCVCIYCVCVCVLIFIFYFYYYIHPCTQNSQYW